MKQREAELKKKVQKKLRKKVQTDKLVIQVTKYKSEDFTKLMEYMHCGSVDMDEYSLPGKYLNNNGINVYY